MGNYLETPNEEIHGAEGSFKCGDHLLQYALASMQGWRMHMEDSHFHYDHLPAVPDLKLQAHTDISFFGVFDGHGGKLASQKSAENLLRVIQQLPCYKELAIPGKDQGSTLEKCIIQGFSKLDEYLKSLEEFKNGDRSGTTAIVAFVTPEYIVSGNCGDSRLIYVRKNAVTFGTDDHKPYAPLEEKRIERAGGHVSMRRVNGDLAVSRALGDFVYKNNDRLPPFEQQVSPEPDVSILKRDHTDDQFLLLACDGIWDVVHNSEACSFVLNKMNQGLSVRNICDDLVKYCMKSRDNTSALILTLPGAPKSIGTVKPEEIATNEMESDDAPVLLVESHTEIRM
mmetsp:Transcript_1837/g.2136  ORF Transcript_1837/g.2136 Transcript_1837/m.2136 type:complete len:340 (-) Transcript_1837:254-1273(-)|eukprot:CAMPEP_0184023276 /NCGR_PEP_ID=MMETSP0954-20121128/11253_1 /TAXON_ID=627963 /ORGANISM="Aplanochytrium sp, Strain PBS07" /LENGTH=339 /DNA_ID=CAMNT_0026306107 /DNA_START=219 /DNA_END=1238 /DNA_ORIENTATION=-